MATKPHILVFPFPAQGHLIPMLNFSHHLAVSGFSLTILVTPKLRPHLDAFLLSTSSLSVTALVLPLPTHPLLPLGVEQVRDLPSPHLVAALMQALSYLHPQIVAWATTHPSPPSLILSEFFLGWTQHLAEDLGIPRVTFYSSSSLTASVVDRTFRHLPEEGGGSPVILPGLPPFPYAHLPSLYRRYRQYSGDSHGGEWELVKNAMLANFASWGAVFNTIEDLEPAHLARLKNEVCGRVWAVGPIAPSDRGGSSQATTDFTDLVAWLDAMPARSVIYVCFGSQFWPTKDQSLALAAALELSGVRFIWAVGNDLAAGGGQVVPEGFEERVEQRGKVVRGWAPQVTILNHEAVSVFVTHCGWNSTLEGIMAGVTLLAWPMEADQFLNARLLVEEAGVAVRVCEGAGSIPNVEKLAKVFKESVEEGTLLEVREKAAEMGRKAKEAVAEGGTSYKDIEMMVKELSELTVKK